MFYPEPGDTIVCNNGEKYTCVSKQDYRYSGLYPDYAIYAYGSGPLSHMIWKTNKGHANYDPDWNIKEIIKMKKNKPHPHAELIKAWADGAEIQAYSGENWHNARHPAWNVDVEYRIKPDEPKFIEVNGVKIPEPYREHPETETQYWIPGLHHGASSDNTRWDGDSFDLKVFNNGLCFKTKEDAAAFANACIRAAKG